MTVGACVQKKREPGLAPRPYLKEEKKRIFNGKCTIDCPGGLDAILTLFLRTASTLQLRAALAPLPAGGRRP